MNIIILTGYFKAKPNFKNNVAFGTLKSEKMFINFVGFGDTANEIVKYNANQLLLIQGSLKMSKYNEEWKPQIEIHSIKALETEIPQSLDDVATLESGNLDEVDLPDDDLPF